jgi:hypothetical protein
MVRIFSATSLRSVELVQHKSPDDQCSDDFVSESKHFIVSDWDADRSVGMRRNVSIMD